MIAKNPPKNVIDSKIKEYCNLPVLLPERELTQAEVEAYWGVDRIDLKLCYEKHKALVKLHEGK
ncbi:hypothetical protein EVB79_091 [Rhizobium phage RHph_N3_13]|nr:hypothetical protein EVB79_091 [Rhizobium phage RHph_N3_13]QIG69916.1 hypothetical protein F67_I3_11_090 [Rhizobium phage RHph_I3_11]